MLLRNYNNSLKVRERIYSKTLLKFGKSTIGIEFFPPDFLFSVYGYSRVGISRLK